MNQHDAAVVNRGARPGLLFDLSLIEPSRWFVSSPLFPFFLFNLSGSVEWAVPIEQEVREGQGEGPGHSKSKRCPKFSRCARISARPIKISQKGPGTMLGLVSALGSLEVCFRRDATAFHEPPAGWRSSIDR
jgi:hypothetical protein